jgi:aspartate racemase
MRAEQGHRLTLGVIGGMGPLATAAFLQTLTIQTDARRDQDHLRVLIESDPQIPDRTSFLLGDGPDPRPQIIAVARRLEEAGADLLVMPCNTASIFTDDIAAAVNVPLVPWISTAVDTVARCGPRVVGLLATTGTLVAGMYQQAFAALGIGTVQPRDAALHDVMDAIYGAGGVKTSGGVAPANRDRLASAAQTLAGEGAEVLLLACTELPLAMPADDPRWPLPAVDPAVEVARRVLRLAGLELTPDLAEAP